jgi:hypothetical protein
MTAPVNVLQAVRSMLQGNEARVLVEHLFTEYDKCIVKLLAAPPDLIIQEQQRAVAHRDILKIFEDAKGIR